MTAPALSAPILSATGLAKRFGAVDAVADVEIAVHPSQIHAVIGPNGAGKSTLTGLLSGTVAPDAGRIAMNGRDVTRAKASARARAGLGRSFQVTSLFPDLSALANVALAVLAHAGHGFRFWRPALADPELTEPARTALARLAPDLDPNRPVAGLAHGERRLVELAMALVAAPKVLLLDEPLAGLGAAENAAVVEIIAGLRATTAILLVEHDMEAVFRLADTVTVLDQGRVVARGTPAEVRADPAVARAYLGEDAP